jgi:hypothetical protein
MKAQELRTKNLLQRNGKIWEVNDIFGSSGLITVYPSNGETMGRLSIHEFEPIPLTEGWLVRFGFGSHPVSNCIKIADRKYLLVNLESEYICLLNDSRGGDHQEFTVNKVCKYVHQLQNLFFAITGEELTITP